MTNHLEVQGDETAIQPRRADALPIGYGSAPRQALVFDSSRFLQFIVQNYKLFIVIVAITVGAGILLTLSQTKLYTAKATVMLDQRKQQLVQGLDDVVSQLPSSDSSTVDTEVQLLNSPGMAYRVAQKLGRIPNVDVQHVPQKDQMRASAEVQDVLDGRRVERVGLTYVIDISYRADTPEAAQKMANAYAQTYIASQIEVRVKANQSAREHLETEIIKLQSQVKQADAAIAAFKAKNNLTDTSLGGTLTEQEISSYNQALAAARAQSADDAQRLAAARGQLDRGADSFGDANSGALAQLRAQESTISNRIADLSSRYGPNHPELLAAQQQLEDVQRLIGQQSQRSVASLAVQAQGSAGRAGAIASRLSATEGALKKASTAAVELHELQMKLDAPRKLLEAYQSRLSQISTQSGNEQSDARIVSLAPLPLGPSSPNWVINMVVSLGAGMILGLLAVLTRLLLARGVSSGEEVELTFGVDFLAALPQLRKADDIAIINNVVDEPTSHLAEALRGLGVGVLVGASATSRIIAVSSPYAEEGKTTTSIALGRVLALRGRRVLVIDCDVHRPSFYDRFGVGSKVGLVDVLHGHASPESAIEKDPRTPADFLSLGADLEPGQSLNEADMAALLAKLRSRYDVILLDLPPVLQLAETRIFAELADTTILLARYKRTSKQAIDNALAILYRARASVMGVVLTQVPTSAAIIAPSYASQAPMYALEGN